MNEDQLQQRRKQIDDLDAEIVLLLNKRASLALEAGEAKQDTPIYDPEREGEVLARIVELSQGPLPKGSLEDIYATIITACREIQLQ